MDQEHNQPSIPNPIEKTEKSQNNQKSQQKQIQFQPPTKNPHQVFTTNPSQQTPNPQHLSPTPQNQNDKDDDNRSQTSSIGEKKRKGSFLSKLSQKQQDQEQKLQEKRKADLKSVFLQNVDYKATKQELQLLFEDCAKIARITILKDPFTNHPKGCAYVSFETEQGVERALYLSGVTLRNRVIKVHRKRTNVPGLHKGKKQDLGKNILGFMQNYTLGAMRGRGRGRGR